jgi:triosephosphate isomerase
MGNWKLYGTKDSILKLIKGIEPAADSEKGIEVVVCPPTIYIEQVANLIAKNNIKLGLQDVSSNMSGAYTGETSSAMAKEFGVKYTLVGHSERREYHNETNEIVAQKFIAAQKGGLTPVLCVGETLEDRETHKTFQVLESQLQAVIKAAGIMAIETAVIAYEPKWAIGTGIVASAEQAQEVHSYIRDWLNKQNPIVAQKVPIIYGGSVKANNAKELFSQPDIDGGLVGGAALVVDEFIGIIKAAK